MTLNAQKSEAERSSSENLESEDRTLKTSWAFYLSPSQAWDALYEDCACAQSSIEMEQYIFNNDDIGQKFMRLFIMKAKRGLRVRLLCDELGSRTFIDSPMIDEFRLSGGVFHFYNSPKFIDIFKPSQFFPRTHLKATVIDGDVAYIGGVCIALRMKDWRDTQIRVTGPVVHQVQKALEHNKDTLVHPRSKDQLHHRPPLAEGAFTYIQNDPGFFRHPIYQSLLDHIKRAQTYVFISTAFFVPPRRFRRYLKEATKRHVKVIVLMPMRSESYLADWASLSYMAGLLKAGVRIFRYKPVILHTKTAVIDGEWGTVGSCNMDSLSFFHNREANLLVKDKEVLTHMHDDFLRDLEYAQELTSDIFSKIPLWKRAFFHLVRILRPIL